MSDYKEYNYWPGFVDALSNVVLTLVFVLVVFVFALVFSSDKLRKRAEQLTTAVEMEALAKQEAVAAQQAAVDQMVMIDAEKASALDNLAKTLEDLDSLEKDNARLAAELKKAKQQTIGQDKTEDLKTQNMELQAQLKAAFQKLKELGLDANAIKEIQKEIKADIGLKNVLDVTDTIQVLAADPAQLGNKPLPGNRNGAIVLVFPRGVFKLDDQAKAALDDVFEKYKDRLANSVASVTSIMGAETYSESRRLAYFRGLSVRNYLIENEHAKGRTVHVQIEQNKEVKDGRVEIRFLRR